MFKHAIHVLTISDRASAGDYADTAGAAAVDALTRAFPEAPISSALVPDGIESVQAGITAARATGVRVVITLGGTGIAPRDYTPEASRPLITRELPGVAEAIRRAGESATVRSVVSRGLAGVMDADDTFDTSSVLVNLAGSENAAVVGCEVLIPLIPHLVMQLDAGNHDE